MAQLPRVPDLRAQREAMKKLGFLVGKWAGEARLLRGPGEWAELLQTEEARFKLDGLVLVIEGVGRAKSGEQSLLQALGVILTTTRAQAIICGRSTMGVFWKPR